MAKKIGWVATEVKGGWKVKLNIRGVDYKDTSARIFKTVRAVESFVSILEGADVTFIHLKNSKFSTE